MDNILILALLAIPLPICGILLTINRGDLKTTMLKYDNKFTGRVSNTYDNIYDMIRVFKVYKNCSAISEKEKKLLRLTLIVFLIGLVDGIVLLIIIISHFFS